LYRYLLFFFEKHFSPPQKENPSVLSIPILGEREKHAPPLGNNTAGSDAAGCLISIIEAIAIYFQSD